VYSTAVFVTIYDMFILDQCLSSEWIPSSVQDLYRLVCIGPMHHNCIDSNLPLERGFKNNLF